MVKKKCGPGCYLEWIADGDRRLRCREHGRYFVLMKGKPIECEGPKQSEAQGRDGV